jgi:hydroxymethylbilane synthase
MKKYKIGTRITDLAKIQTSIVEEELKRKFPLIDFELVEIKSHGEFDLKSPLDQMNMTGIFTALLEKALLRKEIDIAVHSLKDLPTEIHKDLIFAGTLEREDPRDVIIGSTLEALPTEAIIGTGSLRRMAQICRKKPKVTFPKTFRGKIETRLSKLDTKEVDAVILAAAGIKRLNLSSKIDEYLDVENFTPSAGQGALAIQIRKDDTDLLELIKSINHEKTFLEVEVERIILNELHVGCSVPVGIFAKVDEETIRIIVQVISLDGKEFIDHAITGPLEDYKNVAYTAVDYLKSHGAVEIIEKVKKQRDREAGE